MWEIGPGIGALTLRLAPMEIRLTVFEIDHGFARLLKEALSTDGNVRVVEGDFIKTWSDCRRGLGNPDIIVGNLPYSSATAMFLSLIEGGVSARRIVCTVQKEAAMRMMALPGDPDYTSFSVLCALTWRIERLGDLNPGSFYPRPRVRSSILRLEPIDRARVSQPGELLRGVRALFAGRRKTIRNNLRMAVTGNKETIGGLFAEAEGRGFDLQKRPETLSPQRVEELSVILNKYMAYPKD